MTVSDMENAADGSGPPPSWGSDQLDFRSVINAIIDTIRFVTKSDNPDPYTREGMPIPQRQRVLCELGVLRLAVACPVSVGPVASPRVPSGTASAGSPHQPAGFGA